MSNQLIGKNKIVVGLGHIGLPIFHKYFHEDNVVHGVDINEDLIKSLNNGSFKTSEPDLEFSDKMRFFFRTDLPELEGPVHCQICVNAEIRDGKYEIDAVKNLIEGILTKYTDCCVTIRTTLGVEDLVWLRSELTIGDRQSVCFCPEFLREGFALKDLSTNPVYVGPISTGSDFEAKKYFASEVFEDFLTLALLKVTNNAWRATKVSFANKLMLLADGFDIDVSDLHRLFVADDLNVNKSYLKPGEPFGGYCLPKEAQKFVDYEKRFSNSSIAEAVIETNDETIAFWADKISETGRKNIVFEYTSFKKGLEDFRNSQWVRVGDLLRKQGCSVFDWRVTGSDCLHLEDPVFVSISGTVPKEIDTFTFAIMKI